MYEAQETRRVERELDNGQALEAARAELKSEYLHAAVMPLVCSVRVPTDLKPTRREEFMNVFMDGLGWSKNEALQARVVSILREHGMDVLEELAKQHADDYAKDLMGARQ